jgi:predicted DNA-binding transcriptional regulator YafY
MTTTYDAVDMAKEGKQGAEQTLLRRMTLLSHIPATDGTSGLTTSELTRRLNESGFTCGKRTVERDLKAIHEKDCVTWRAIGVHLERHATDTATARWRHAATSKAMLLKALTSEDALLLSLLEQELKYFLPASASASLAQYQEPTRRVLSLPGNQRQSTFHDRFRVISDVLMDPPVPHVPHLQEINEALLRQEQLDMEYTSSGEQKAYRLHPIGLVRQGLFYWLVAVKDENTLGEKRPIVQTFRLNRIVSVKRRQHETVARALPTLNAALDGGILHFFSKGSIALRLRFAPNKSGQELCNNYLEAPLSGDQKVFHGLGGHMELRATVFHSRQLVWMLQGQANLVRVEEPSALKDEINQFLAKAHAFQA